MQDDGTSVHASLIARILPDAKRDGKQCRLTQSNSPILHQGIKTAIRDI